MFKDNTSLKEIKICSPLTAIDNNAFNGCVNLSEVNLNSVSHIGSKAFKDCKSLNKICISNLSCLISISSKVFHNCSSLDKMVIQSSVKSFVFD